jgi:hypothetical protein
MSISSTDTVPRCQNGRFNLALNGARFPAGAIYRVQLEMVGIDSTGREFRNAGTGNLEISVSR